MRGRLTIALTVMAVCFAACGDGVDGEDAGAATSTAESETAADGGEPVEIVVRYDHLPDGEVLPESQIGDSPFCPGRDNA
jgi:hypothetical protein